MYRYSWLSIDEGAHVGEIKVKRGRTTFISWGCNIVGDIEIGDGCLIGPNVVICSSIHGIKIGVHIKDQKTIQKKIVIGNGVWIGAGAIILGGNTIGNNVVIGAGSVLTYDNVIGENEIWSGNPCKFLKYRT